MKAFLRQLLSSFLALLVLASTVSWTVEKHYCMGHLVDVSLFSDADNCGMSAALEMQDESSCCSDEVFVLDGQDDLKISLDQFSLDQVVFVATLFYQYNHLLQGTSKPAPPFDGYPPPLLISDFQLLYETFLI